MWPHYSLEVSKFNILLDNVLLLEHTSATNLLWLQMKILGNVWDEWDGTEPKATSQVG